ncbi:MAG: pyrroloquinoline quinone precursor peptide PqqA [Alphaproteobacteria bacterium]|jgi:coenzyme PQQ precursor peptide PqqA
MISPINNPRNGRIAMTWTTPKIFEISVGLEINSYACAEA